MEQGLKQRLVGAFVIIVLVVIFLPMLLKGNADDVSKATLASKPASGVVAPPAEQSGAREEAAPPDAARQFSARPVEPAPRKSRPVVVPEPAGEPLATEKPARTETKAPEAPREAPAKVESSRETASIASGWVVQVGSFAKPVNALRLRDRLRSRGYSAFVHTVDGERGKMTRVLVGPQVERTQSERVAGKLKRGANLDGMVMRYPSN